MIQTQIFSPDDLPGTQQKSDIVDFLHEHLDQYGDERRHILKAVDYALGESRSFGGYLFALYDGPTLKGAVVINKTGMGGYIPENILVYIATHKDHRGEGLGKMLMEKVLGHVEGDVALHVEANNPAKKLYEKFGFTNPYLEMRLKR